MNLRVLSGAVILFSSGVVLAQVARFEAPGNLESNHPLGCVPLEQVTGQHTPADIYHGIGACLEGQDFRSAARLFAIARAYGRFDTMRVSDETAHAAMGVLNLAVLGDVGGDVQQSFEAAIDAEFGPERLAHNCGVISGIGRPTYHPAYMIQHGLDASAPPWQEPETEDGLVEDFNAVAAWNQVMASVLECDVDSPQPAQEEGNSISFDGEQYHLAWTAEGPTVFEEYLRSGETVESWTRMLTFSMSEDTAQDVVSLYLEQRQNLMAFEPEIWEAAESRYTDDLMITLVLATPDQPGAEFVLARVVGNPGEPTRVLVFSTRLGSAGQEEVEQALARRDEWVAELAAFSLAAP